MGKTFANLKDALAGALGYDVYTDLSARDQADIETIVNAAYFDCFAAKDGRRPSWAVTYHSDMVKAPVSTTLGLISGSTAVTGFAFEAKYVGSFVRIGDSFYRLGLVATGPAYALLQPWSGATGSFDATVYYNAVALPGKVTKVREAPSILGLGILAPMPFPQSEVELRSTPAYDFYSLSGPRAPFAFSRPRFNASLITDVGDPCYYHIDSASVGSTFATGSRLHLFPIPGAAFTFELRADLLPLPLAADGDEPLLPHDDVDVAGAILMPFIFERLLKHPLGRRYAGNNADAIFAGANDARAILNTFRNVQLSGPKLVRTSRNW